VKMLSKMIKWQSKHAMIVSACGFKGGRASWADTLRSQNIPYSILADQNQPKAIRLLTCNNIERSQTTRTTVLQSPRSGFDIITIWNYPTCS
jgi:hypothetical protein